MMDYEAGSDKPGIQRWSSLLHARLGGALTRREQEKKKEKRLLRGKLWQAEKSKQMRLDDNPDLLTYRGLHTQVSCRALDVRD